MPKLPVVKVRELIRVLNRLGFFEHHRVGSHAQFKHPDGRRTTVPVHYGKDVKRGMLRGILNDISIDPEDFFDLLKAGKGIKATSLIRILKKIDKESGNK